MNQIEEMPQWMEKYIPAMMEQWCGPGVSNISTIKDLIEYRLNLGDKSFSYPNRDTFDINMNIKIEFLKILNKDFKME